MMAIFLIFRARHADYLSILAITKTFMNALKEKALFLRGFANRLSYRNTIPIALLFF